MEKGFKAIVLKHGNIVLLDANSDFVASIFEERKGGSLL